MFMLLFWASLTFQSTVIWSTNIRRTEWDCVVWKNITLISCGIFLGGPLTVTDANLALGRLLPSFFPKIFGPEESEPLCLEETMKHFRHLTQEINLFLTSNQAQTVTLILLSIE